MGSGLRAVAALCRPFTLLPPALGFASGAVTAAGAEPSIPFSSDVLLHAGIGTVMAAVLNAASNALNQIFDLEIDRLNKPERPLPSGRMTLRTAWTWTMTLYAVALGLAWLVAPGGRRDCFWIVVVAAAFTVLYSAPPARTKRFGLLANLTIAIPRGVLLKVAGWAAVKPALTLEPWFIGGIFGLFLLGASTTKDFADMPGDARAGCRTLPVVYGVRRAAWIVAPFFVLPFALISAGAAAGILTGHLLALQLLAVVLSVYGLFVCALMLQRPEALAAERNHPSWAHMYWMMLLAQAGFAAAYLL